LEKTRPQHLFHPEKLVCRPFLAQLNACRARRSLMSEHGTKTRSNLARIAHFVGLTTRRTRRCFRKISRCGLCADGLQLSDGLPFRP
jgi:hypothetical protein